MSERDRRCTSVQLMPATDPSYDNRTIASTFKMQIWIATNNKDVPRVMKTKFPATVMVFGVVSSEGQIMLRSRLESQHQSVPSLYALLPRPEPAGLLRLVIHREHRQYDLPQHQSQPDHRHPPNIRRAPAGAC